MKLYLVQHGNAVSKDINPVRPLSEKGQQDARNLAAFLGRGGVCVQKVLHSGKTRAEQTAVILAEVIMPGGEVESVAGIAPNDAVEAFAAMLGSWRRDTFVIGHLPFLARLVSFLLIGDVDRELVGYMPGSVVCLECDDSGTWCVNWMMRPEMLIVK